MYITHSNTYSTSYLFPSISRGSLGNQFAKNFMGLTTEDTVTHSGGLPMCKYLVGWLRGFFVFRKNSGRPVRRVSVSHAVEQQREDETTKGPLARYL